MRIMGKKAKTGKPLAKAKGSKYDEERILIEEFRNLISKIEKDTINHIAEISDLAATFEALLNIETFDDNRRGEWRKLFDDAILDITSYFNGKLKIDINDDEILSSFDVISRERFDVFNLTSAVSAAIGAALFIGMEWALHSQNSPAATEETLQKLHQAHASMMRAALSEMASKKREALKAALKAVIIRDRLTLAISIEFAGIVRPEVCKELGIDPKADGYPSTATIKAALREIKNGSG